MADAPERGLRYGLVVFITGVVCVLVVAFAYTAGWLTPDRLTPKKLVASLAPADGPALGHRRNHAKGICFTGEFEANGAGSSLSKAVLLERGRYPVVGRFNLGTADPQAKDGMVRVRGIGIQIVAPDGQQWRSAMIDLPFFPVATPQGFYDLQMASNSKDPGAMKGFVASHPEFAHFAGWVKDDPWTGSYAEERYNSLNSFVFEEANGRRHVVRWSLVPEAPVVPLPAEELQRRDADFLEQEITARVGAGPQRWRMVVTLAEPGDPTADPSKAWPAERRTIEVGTLTAERVEPERDGPCRDINFDPTVLPAGMTTSDDPFPSARSAAYSRSFNSRTAEERYYPRTPAGGTK